MHDMFEHTDTNKAPWHVVDGNDKKAARISALSYIAERLERSVSMVPPEIDPAIVEMARSEFGKP
jgi:hypothetical protein